MFKWNKTLTLSDLESKDACPKYKNIFLSIFPLGKAVINEKNLQKFKNKSASKEDFYYAMYYLLDYFNVYSDIAVDWYNHNPHRMSSLIKLLKENS